MAAESSNQEAGFLKSSYPVLLPAHSAFTLPDEEFREFVRLELAQAKADEAKCDDSQDELIAEPLAEANEDSITLISAPSTTDGLRQPIADLELRSQTTDQDDKESISGSYTHVIDTDALNSNDEIQDIPATENKMLTENADIAYRSTTNALVDLFAELEDVVSGPRLRELLTAAWQEDPLATLKIIFNARSIHIGKSSRLVFYRCAGWLAREHPATLLTNLQWLCRPVIRKDKKVEGDKEDVSLLEVKEGVAHGYYKDLLNILVLAAHCQLDVLSNPRDVLNVESEKSKRNREWNAEKAKAQRHDSRQKSHNDVLTKFAKEPFYRLLHITIARLFASQLATDLTLLHSDDVKARRGISLCAKWAPSHKLFHDKNTFIISSIAEILHPESEFKDASDREVYLRHAREAYRKDVAALRKSLEIVERDISAQKFSNIKYDHVPSLAMDRYTKLFAQKDPERFDTYIENVTEGKQKISGAVLLPSKIISTVRERHVAHVRASRKSKSVKVMVEEKMNQLKTKAIDGQWKTLVQRIRDSGSLSSSIAVCDVSGSMSGPRFPDGTVPMDSAIGLSLLVAEVTAAPFGGRFITFSSNPKMQEINLEDTLHDKVRKMESAEWRMSTDFVAVFTKLILPEAKLHKVKPEDMVKRVFVFSDMQFNAAQHTHGSGTWSSSFERVSEAYKEAGYEMPQLVFWNLAGGRAGYAGGLGQGDPVAPKPVVSDEEGTALVSGYSQGLLKVFLDNGQFEEPEEAVEKEIVVTEGAAGGGVGDDEDEVVVEKRKRVKVDPFVTVKKAISHDAYSVLTVVD